MIDMPVGINLDMAMGSLDLCSGPQGGQSMRALSAYYLGLCPFVAALFFALHSH